MFTSGLIGGVGGGGSERWSVVSVYLGIDWRGWGVVSGERGECLPRD